MKKLPASWLGSMLWLGQTDTCEQICVHLAWLEGKIMYGSNFPNWQNNNREDWWRQL